MAHLFRGNLITDAQLRPYLSTLEATLTKDIAAEPPSQTMVIQAILALAQSLDYDALKDDLTAMGLTDWQAEDFIQTVRKSLTEEALTNKVLRELGPNHDRWQTIEPGIEEKRVPYGVLTHVGAGNVVALSALSVLEGLLAGNINILKLPSYEGGISMRLLEALVTIQPALKPYVYVFDIPSKDEEAMKILATVSDGVVVWGSDEAIAGIRHLAPPSLPIIQWGHRLSFAYLAPSASLDEAIDGLGKEICLSNQLYCSSPQSVFFETHDPKVLDAVAKKLINALEKYDAIYPQGAVPIHNTGEITWTRKMVETEAVFGCQKLYQSPKSNLSVLVDDCPSLKASPKYRNIWLMPIDPSAIQAVLRPYKNHLQTVGLCADEPHRSALAEQFYKAGANRVTDCGHMSVTYTGEPHDGHPTLAQYTRQVSRRF